MDLGLPPPPDMVARQTTRRRSNAGIVALSLALAGLVLCACGGFAGFMAFIFGQAAEPARREVGPWLQLLVEERYEEAARECGTGVTAADLRAAVDRGVGAPLRSFEPKGGAKLNINVTSEAEGYTLTYRMQGSRCSADVSVKYVRSTSRQSPLERGSRSERKIAIPEWGIEPGFAEVSGEGRLSGPPFAESVAPERPLVTSREPTADADKGRGEGLRLPSGQPEAEAPE